MNFDLQAIQASLESQIVPFGGKVLGALLVLFLARVVAGWAARAVEISCEKTKVDETLTRFAIRATTYLIMIIAVVGCLGAFGIETTSFAAVLGAAGFAVGLAFQGTLSSFSAGVMLLVFRPFKVGDMVTVAGQTGKVFEIELFTTALDTPDKRRIILPNSSVFGSTIENVTYHPVRRCDVAVGVAYDSDIDRTREVLMAAVTSLEKIEADPAPAVMLTGLGASSVDWSVRCWAKKEDFWGVKEALIRAVKNGLDEAGISIPHTTIDLHWLSTPAQGKVELSGGGAA